MQLKKPQTIIITFVVLWIILIGWGIVKTTLKLSSHKALLEQPLPQKPEIPKPLQKPEILKPAVKPLVKKIPREQEAAPTLTRTFKVKPTDFADLLPVMGTVKGQREIELRFEINGVIKSIYFREGEKIKKGELVASLEQRDAQLKLTYAKNRLAAAEATYQSSLKKLEIHQKLYEAGAIIKAKLEEVELECESIKFRLETVRNEEQLAKYELEKTNLYAPIKGVMGPREAEQGEFVTPQDRLALFLGIDKVLVEVGIVERDINKIKLGQKAKVFVDAYPDIAFEGTIDNIFPVVEGRSRTLTAKIKLNNPEGLLLPGMFCRAEVVIIELKDALLIPSTSLIPTEQGITLVPVIPGQSIETGEDEIKTGTVQLRPITIGYKTSDYVQVTQGLKEGDLVVIESRGKLKDNTPVHIAAIEEPSF